jgi:hypothetical protein
MYENEKKSSIFFLKRARGKRRSKKVVYLNKEHNMHVWKYHNKTAFTINIC